MRVAAELVPFGRYGAKKRTEVDAAMTSGTLSSSGSCLRRPPAAAAKAHSEPGS
jgi:hypothetical protein